MRKAGVGCWVLGVGCCFLTCPVVAQPPPALTPNTQHPTPNTQHPTPTLLPRFDFDFRKGTVTYESLPDGATRMTGQGRPVFTMGDLRVEADRIVADMQGLTPLRVEATGNVVIQRGDESLRGESFVFEGESGDFRAGIAFVMTPPFAVQADGITGERGAIRLTRPRIGVGEGGAFSFFAEEASLSRPPQTATQTPSRPRPATLRLRNATFSLFGARILTVRRVSVPLTASQSRREGPASLGSLFSLRSSRISGLGVSFGLPFTPARGYAGLARVDVTTRGGIQPIVTVRHDFLFPLTGQSAGQSERPFYSLPGQIAPGLRDASPIRRIITARALPPPYDPILDFNDILPESNLLERPALTLSRDGSFQATAAYNREGTGRRGGTVFLTRLPEASASAHLPLSSSPPAADNAAARRFLKSPHLLLDGGASLGYFRETQRDAPGRPRVSASRVAATFGFGLAPLLVGENTLFRAQTQIRGYGYGGKGHYSVGEVSVAAQQIIGQRSALGVAYFWRDQSGATPFLTDRIDARYEGQIRGQYSFSKNRLTLAALARYDANEGKIFDYQFALGYRKGSVEPRLAYRTVNRQFLFTIAFPGLTERQ